MPSLYVQYTAERGERLEIRGEQGIKFPRYTQGLRRLLLLALAAWNLAGAVSPEYAERRAKLRKVIPDGVLVLFGAKESDDAHDAFFQETNFYYLTGWEEPGAILVMTPEPDKADPSYAERAAAPREILFVPRRVVSTEKWTGRKQGPSDAELAGDAGVEKVLAAEAFETQLRGLMELYPSLYALHGDAVQKMAPLRTIQDASPIIGKLRMTKSAAEIAAIQHATDVSIEGHRAAWKVLKPGMFEYQAEGVMVGLYLDRGCLRPAYAPIVGSGPNSSTLHYSRDTRRMDAGEVVVMDAAAECAYYASDITRTVPASGRYSARQREIYDVVLGAERAAIAAVKPGMTFARTGPNSLYKIAYDYINTHGKDLHGEPLGKYFTHGLTHHVGLDVHDETDNTTVLAAGMVITIEPGVYIPEENIGVRVEDVVLVTETGAKVLSAALPSDPDEIERALAAGK
jgi:Xaa-Pro aminopeptidase